MPPAGEDEMKYEPGNHTSSVRENTWRYTSWRFDAVVWAGDPFPQFEYCTRLALRTSDQNIS